MELFIQFYLHTSLLTAFLHSILPAYITTYTFIAFNSTCIHHYLQLYCIQLYLNNVRIGEEKNGKNIVYLSHV